MINLNSSDSKVFKYGDDSCTATVTDWNSPVKMDSRKSLLILCLVGVCAFGSVSARDCAPAGENCTLPYCFCPGWEAPGGLDSIIDEVPQIVLLTFDDAITVSNHPMYEEALFERKNPNGAKVSATFFVTHEYNNYQLTHDLYRRGHEIALHSITHRTDTQYWQTMNESNWRAEVCDQKKQMAHFAKIPAEKIKGFRVPFLQPGGDRQWAAMASLECDLDYDCSRPTRSYAGDTPNKLWPYTQDYDPQFQDCLTTPCPEQTYPGFWTVPMVSWFGGNGFPCAMVDTCIPSPETTQEMYDLLKRNFDKHYETPTTGGIGNRAPFSLFFHAAFMQGEDNEHRWRGFIQFLDYLGTKDDVYIVSIQRALEWIKFPEPLPDAEDFPPWNDETPPIDQCGFPFSCAFSNDQTPMPGERYMISCQPCPRNYPWINNPLGDL